jgi:hypothetical protein
VLVQAKAFAPLRPIHLSSTSTSGTVATWTSCSFTTTTELYGLRSFLRKRFFPRKNCNEHQQQPKPLIFEDCIDELRSLYLPVCSEDVPLAAMSVSTVPDLIGQRSATKSVVRSSTNGAMGSTGQLAVTGVIVGILTDTSEDRIFNEHAEPTLPPRDDAQLTPFEREYRNMLSEFLPYTKQDDIAHVRSPRLRALFAGIAASYDIPEVYRSFEILFEDYAPLRIGGRLIYAQLKQAMMEAQRERKQEVQSISQVTGLSNEEIEASRIAWLKMAVHHKDDRAAQLTIQQLIDLGLAETVAEVLGHDDFEGWLNSFNKNFTSDKVTFCELMVALQNCSVDSNRPECDPNTILPEIAKRLGPRQTVFDVRRLSDKKRRYISKYDGMVQSFLEWREHVPTDSRSRKMDVLRGCFAGAESVEIVDALRIVYVDYSALRFAGNLIFTVMKTLVGSFSSTSKLSQSSP